MPAASVQAAWQAALAQRVRRYFWLKASGVTAFTWLFFIAYFQLLRHPAYPVTPMPLTGLDHWVAFQPAGLAPYVSLWIYLGVAPGLMLTLGGLIRYGLWAAAMCCSGLACFYFWPTSVPPLVVDVVRYPMFALLQGVDAAGNACPSLHVATAVFSALWIEHLLRAIGAPAWLRSINVVWVVAITWSTLAIKQHVALDVAAGLLLGAVFAAVSLRLSSRR